MIARLLSESRHAQLNADHPVVLNLQKDAEQAVH